MRSTPDITRKSLLIGSAWGLLAITAGCAKATTGSDALPSGTPTASAATVTPAWSYEGAEGPGDWGNLSPTFQTCSAGKAQSPIDIPAATPKSPAPISLAYSASDCEVHDNGHTVELHAGSAQSLTVSGKDYTFKQMHFHDPSEHTIGGTRYDVEFHFVHQSDDGGLAVVGLLAKAGKANAAWAPFVDAAAGSASARSIGSIDLASLLPASLEHFAYEGSLTTPPCTENVLWLVLDQPIELGADQVGKLRAVHSGNNRPTQELNNRTVTLVNQ
jgi:carbonic anhydrase